MAHAVRRSVAASAHESLSQYLFTEKKQTIRRPDNRPPFAANREWEVGLSRQVSFASQLANSRTASRNTLVCLSTSSASVCGHISAILWKV